MMNENRLENLSRCEQIVMEEIWRLGQAESCQIRETLEERGINWKAQTISTFTTRLRKKGYLEMHRKGKQFFYIPKVNCERYVEKLKEELEDFCRITGV